MHHLQVGVMLLIVLGADSLLGFRPPARAEPQDDRGGRSVEGGGGAPPYAASHALLIGVSNYTAGWSTLPSIPRELAQVEQALQKHGFEVEKTLDPTSESLKGALDRFTRDYGYEPDNRLIIFFAGHGHTRRGGEKGYVVPADAPKASDDIGFAKSAISMDQIRTYAEDMEARHVLFIFDSCFSGTIFGTRGHGEPAGITQRTARPVRQFITAGGAGQTVPARSVFVPSLVRALEGDADLSRDGYVTGVELGEFLYDEVTRYGQGQTPQAGKLNDPSWNEGDFVFELASAHDGERGGPSPAAADRTQHGLEADRGPTSAGDPLGGISEDLEREAYEAYLDLAELFNDRLSGKFPFGPATVLDSANPYDVRVFFGSGFDEAHNLIANLPDESSWFGGAKAEAQEWMLMMRQVQVFFGAFLPSPGGEDSVWEAPVWDFKVSRVLPEQERGSREIAKWLLTIDQETIDILEPHPTLPDGRWEYGDPVTLSLIWADDSPYIPYIPHSDGGSSTRVTFEERELRYEYHERWSLLRLLVEHEASAQHFAEGDPHPETLRLDAEVVSDSSGTREVARVFLRLTLLDPDWGHELWMPAFPITAPRIRSPRDSEGLGASR